MFRRWLSSFWRANKQKIKQIAKLLGVLIVIGVSAGLIFSKLTPKSNTSDNETEIYQPKDAVITGGQISQKDYEQENTVIEKFVEFCNEQNSTEAYNMLTDECKEKLYPTLQDFEEKYYKVIFGEKREYTLQGWITERDYNTYKIRYTDDFMETGSYEQTDKYEDYITIVTDGENKKININGYVKLEEVNKKTKTDELEIEVLTADTYMNYVVYTINVKNLTNQDILLDSIDNNNNIKLIGTNNVNYKLDTTNLKMLNLKISANGEKEVILTFRKTHGSGVKGSKIQFTNVITNYIEYRKNKEEYKDYKNLIINL